MLQPSELVQETHIKSALDVVLEQSQKRLLEMRKQLADNPAELAKKEKAFLQNEITKLEAMGNHQTKLEDYRKVSDGLKPGQRAKEAQKSNNSDKLGNNLRALGQHRIGKDWHAHHIVCSRHASHAAARMKLFAYLGLNDPYNGCWLPTKHKYATGTIYPKAVGHSYLHTNKYAEWVRRHLRPVNSKQGLENMLLDLKRDLLSMTDVLAKDILTDKGQEDFKTHS